MARGAAFFDLDRTLLRGASGPVISEALARAGVTDRRIPGEQVIYTVTFENVGDKPATDVAIVNPVPEHTTYVAGSAGGPGTEVSFSEDGGRTGGAPEQLKLRGADGTERAATPADYTHVRWVLRNPLTPGAVAFARYRVVVK